jgi:hypothetical protein
VSILHVRHIEAALDGSFDEQVDLSDVALSDDATQRSTFLTRSLAAFPVVAFTGASPAEVALGVTDGTGDNGIDLVHYDTTQERLYLVQAKWRADGNGSPAVADVQKFLQGIRDLVNLDFDRFNAKVQSLARVITGALDNPRVTIEALFVHTGSQEQTEQIDNLYGDLLSVMNDGGEILVLRTLKQSDIHGLVSGEVEGVGIDLDIALFDWGQLSDPYVAYYGQVSASDVAAWHREHGSALFARNLRKFIVNSDVNHTIADSVRSAPDSFWYLNNGVTMLCQSISKKAIGGTDRRHGQFACEGISIVNGAQTVGSIGAALADDASGEATNADARVLLRLISLEGCPPEFATAVTRATNTQNRIVSRDFVALDEEQERLRIELRLDGKVYALKTGDPDPVPDEGCSVVDATVALGCADPDVQVAVQVKREIGRIWESTQSSMYRRLFNSGTTSTKVWRSVAVMRAVDATLLTIQRSEQGRRRQVGVHGNRLILHTVLRSLPIEAFLEGHDPPDLDQARALTKSAFESMCSKIDRDYEGNYLASLFKNQTRCKDVASAVMVELARA